jgi:hypothetical protein
MVTLFGRNPIEAPGTGEGTCRDWCELGHLPAADVTGVIRQ